jgi:hypothetical protein
MNAAFRRSVQVRPVFIQSQLEHFQLLRSAGSPVPHCGVQATFQSPLSYGWNTGQECPANPQTRMSALPERWNRASGKAARQRSPADICGGAAGLRRRVGNFRQRNGDKAVWDDFPKQTPLSPLPCPTSPPPGFGLWWSFNHAGPLPHECGVPSQCPGAPGFHSVAIRAFPVIT